MLKYITRNKMQNNNNNNDSNNDDNHNNNKLSVAHRHCNFATWKTAAITIEYLFSA